MALFSASAYAHDNILAEQGLGQAMGHYLTETDHLLANAVLGLVLGGAVAIVRGARKWAFGAWASGGAVAGAAAILLFGLG